MTITLDPFNLGGAANTAVLGSGVAVPTGLEALLEYNGLFLNNTSIADKFRINEISGFDDADIRDVREVNPGHHGETAYEALYGGRTITLTGRIEAYSLEKLRDMQHALRSAFADLTEKPLTVRTGSFARDHQIYCRKSSPIQMREVQADWNFFRDFMLTLRASDPRIVSFQQQVATIDNEVEINSATLENKGNFSAQPLIVIKGNAVNPRIENATTDEVMQIFGTIPADEEFILDIKGRTMKNSAGTNVFRYLDIDSDWITLAPGNNVILTSSDSVSAASEVTFNWRHSWL